MILRFILITLVVTLLLPAIAAGQNQQVSSMELAFEKRDWLLKKVGTGETRNYLGREAVFLERSQITLKDSLFSEGVIEFDLAAEQASGFVGLSFRADEAGNGEQFYVRFHQSGQPDSTQYLAKLNIKTDKDTSRLFRFGYSDRVRIYVNGEQQFFGNAQWRSRDHRFLGTIGLHDAVPLHLKAGSNEVIAAVSESFGGWGFIGQIENPAGLIIE